MTIQQQEHVRTLLTLRNEIVALGSAQPGDHDQILRRLRDEMATQQREHAQTLMRLRGNMTAQHEEHAQTLRRLRDNMTAQQGEHAQTLTRLRNNMTIQRDEHAQALLTLRDNMTLQQEEHVHALLMLRDEIVALRSTLDAVNQTANDCCADNSYPSHIADSPVESTSHFELPIGTTKDGSIADSPMESTSHFEQLAGTTDVAGSKDVGSTAIPAKDPKVSGLDPKGNPKHIPPATQQDAGEVTLRGEHINMPFEYESGGYDYYGQSDLEMAMRLDSLSEQMALLEERIGSCKSCAN